MVFCDSNSQVSEVARIARTYIIFFPIGRISIVIVYYFQSFQQKKKAWICSLSRTVVFTIPLLCILPAKFGVLGIWVNQLISDILAFLLLIFLLRFEFVRLTKLEDYK